MPTLRRRLYGLCCILLLAALSGCVGLAPRDPLRIDLAGLEPLSGESLEMRFVVTLRIQNPNAQAVSFEGVSLELDLNEQPLASGVSNQKGQISAFGETLIRVPLTISAYSMLRQAYAISNHTGGSNLPYVLRGKLGGGLFGSEYFNASGTLDWPPSATPLNRTAPSH